MIARWTDTGRLGITTHTACITLTPEQAQCLRVFLNMSDSVRQMRPLKRWDKCDIEGHTDDCVCGGTGGDR